jgi:hypothetical protein
MLATGVLFAIMAIIGIVAAVAGPGLAGDAGEAGIRLTGIIWAIVFGRAVPGLPVHRLAFR